MAHLYDPDEMDAIQMYRNAMLQRAGGVARRFDEYYRCYPLNMMPGPDKGPANHGGKIFLPASALEQLTRLHITYPMLFELINGAKERRTHAGVLEFTAEEGRIYLPQWLMNTLLLEAGDLLQIKSTDLPPGNFIKLKPQSVDFLDITDPKAVLENAFRNFSCLTKGDIFSFEYNDHIYEIEVLEVKPDQASHAICTMETDLSVDFAPPVGYEESLKKQETSATSKMPKPGVVHTQGSMAQAINYSAIAPATDPSSTDASAAAAAANFHGTGNRLGRKTNRTAASSGTATPTAGDINHPPPSVARRRDGPQPLRLPHGKLFFGFPYTAPKAKPKNGEPAADDEDDPKLHFSGMGQTLRGKKIDGSGASTPAAAPDPSQQQDGQKLGRKLRDA